MLKILIIFLFLGCMNIAHAETCPKFYRFIDFGIEGNDGKTYRGGTLLRAEGFDGKALLVTRLTNCLLIRDIAKDGRGNPIPVVTSIHYDPQIIAPELEELRVSKVKNTTKSALDNARIHRTRLQKTDPKVTRGSNFLCVSDKKSNEVSCQIKSPYSGNLPLIIYCDLNQCTAPVIAINGELQIGATWKNKILLEETKAIGVQNTNFIKQIHDFLAPLSASF